MDPKSNYTSNQCIYFSILLDWRSHLAKTLFIFHKYLKYIKSTLFIENYLHFMKNCIRPLYEKLKPLKSGFIENSNFENNRDPLLNLAQEDLNSFLAVAEELEVKGLTPGEHLSNCDPGEIIWQIAGECLQHPPWLLGNIYTGLDP